MRFGPQARRPVCSSADSRARYLATMRRFVRDAVVRFVLRPEREGGAEPSSYALAKGFRVVLENVDGKEGLLKICTFGPLTFARGILRPNR